MKILATYKIAALMVAAFSISACKQNKCAQSENERETVVATNDSTPLTIKHLAVDKQRIMPYVTCSEHTVDSLLAIADTVYSQTDAYKLADLDMGAAYMNDGIQKAYNDTIPLVLSLFDTYARMVNSEMDEANAAFVWHEVATKQMKHFFEKACGKWEDKNDTEAIFRIINHMMYIYGAGSQYDMNCAAWRSIMPIDYRLIAAYKQLMDLCKDPHIVKLVNDDYMYILNTFHDYCSSSEEWYSDLAREQGEMFQLLLKAKLEHVQRLVAKYEKGNIDNHTVLTSLKEHRVYWDKKDVKLNIHVLSNMKNAVR